MQAQKANNQLEAAKKHLAACGLSYRKAAPLCNVGYQFLSDVLNGHETSAPLIKRVMALPKKKEVAA